MVETLNRGSVRAAPEAPNSKLKAPQKSGDGNTKHQAPTTKKPPISNLQTATGPSEPVAWSLELLWCLELGVWCLSGLIDHCVRLFTAGASHATRPSNTAARRDRRMRPRTDSARPRAYGDD